MCPAYQRLSFHLAITLSPGLKSAMAAGEHTPEEELAAKKEKKTNAVSKQYESTAC